MIHKSVVISKGPKYRVPDHTDFNKCRETIASALNDYCTRWCKQEHVESNALNNWKLKPKQTSYVILVTETL